MGGMKRALLLLPVLLLPACGGGDDADPKAEFVAKAEAVCATAKAEREKNPQPTKLEALPAYVETLVGIAERAERDLRALELPEDDATDLRSELLDPFAADIRAGKEFSLQVNAAAGDGAKLLGLLAKRPKTTVDIDFANSYGLPTCAAAVSS
jgi:hypothetical protein